MYWKNYSKNRELISLFERSSFKEKKDTFYKIGILTKTKQYLENPDLLIYFDVDDEIRLDNRIQRDLAKRKRSWWKVYKRKF